MTGPVSRVVAVGASNLTRGFHTIVSTARAVWGPDVEVLAALGHGRAYGGPSTFLVRGLPGILQSGLWRELESRPPAPARALVTDVGNDIMWGHSPAQILEWVDVCVARLQQVTRDVVVTSLPPAAVAGLPAWRYVFFRSIFFPRCRLTLDQTVRAGAEVDAGLQALAGRRGAAFVRLKPEWYGIDPIHIRPGMWNAAWREILCGEYPAVARPRSTRGEAIRLYCLQPERATFFGLERRHPQRGVALRGGGRVWLY
ncbi:MAG: hypothetical protein ACM3H9_04070 [Rhodospirillaceae bacterium]